MSHFTNEFPAFFKSLTKNNSTDWFDKNRKTYETCVKKPFHAFVEEMIARIQKHDPSVKVKASDCIFRINKDIRFSKDKTPYNTHMSANISPQGRKSKEDPGIYFQLGADKIAVYGGAYMLEKDSLANVRKAIAKNPAGFDKLINAPAFKKKFGPIQGEKNKVLPPDLKAAAEKYPLVANKSFYFTAELSGKEITSPKLADLLMDYYAAAKPVNDYLAKAMKGK
jgi:uncharacterized protein (TIGR02453 family)